MITERLLKKIAETATLSAPNADQLLSCARQEVLPKGHRILDEGQICNHLYFVEKGWLRTYSLIDTKPINIDFTFEGEFTSNIKSLKKEQPAQCVIETGEKSVVTFFDKKDLLELYSTSHEIEVLCRRILAAFLIETDERVSLYKLLTPLERYAFLLKDKPEWIRRIPVSQLASYLGVARETLSRIRKNIT